MASRTAFSTLPAELIAHVATFTDALSVLRLSTTCHRVRQACYDSLVFKEILERSQHIQWNRDCLDIAAVASLAAGDVTKWARYALADQRTFDLSCKECPLESPERFLSWLPEIMLLQHPFMHYQCWSRFLRDGSRQDMRQVYCQAMAILASGSDMDQLGRSLKMLEDPVDRLSTAAFLWALCEAVLVIRASVRTRLAAWLYNNAARVAYIQAPEVAQIPIIGDLPLPFGETGSWQRWYETHNDVALSDVNYLTQGSWCGYYTYLGPQSQYVDPPMSNIRFREMFSDQPMLSCCRQPTGELWVRAENCQDGIDDFSISGGFRRIWLEDGSRHIEFIGRKMYASNDTTWGWQLRVTPFGLVGFWGHSDGSGRGVRFRERGLVWLWKEEWTQRQRP